MDLHSLISVLSVMYAWIFCTVLWAPAASVTPTMSTGPTGPPEHHVRTKRCSCATFMDKECVYFCHLDIIWVNTPERVVSYGLGNAPRTRRALSDSMATSGGPRCACLREHDGKCQNFCRLRYDSVLRSPGGDTSRSNRMKSTSREAAAAAAWPVALRAALRTRLLLDKWRVRQRHRARARQGDSAAP